MDEPFWLYIEIFFTNCTSMTSEPGWWYAKSNLFYFFRRHWEFVSALSVFSCEDVHRIDILEYDSCQFISACFPILSVPPMNPSTPPADGADKVPLITKAPFDNIEEASPFFKICHRGRLHSIYITVTRPDPCYQHQGVSFHYQQPLWNPQTRNR